MAKIYIDTSVIEDVATELGMTPAQARAWFRSEVGRVRAIRAYVQTHRVVSAEAIEAEAVPGETLDPVFVSRVMVMLRVGGLVEEMDDVTL